MMLRDCLRNEFPPHFPGSGRPRDNVTESRDARPARGRGGAFFRHSQFGVRPAGHTQRRRPHLRVLQDEASREVQALFAQVRWFVARPMLEWDSVRAATGFDQVRRRDDVQAERDDVEEGNGEVHAAGESFHVV